MQAYRKPVGTRALVYVPYTSCAVGILNVGALLLYNPNLAKGDYSCPLFLFLLVTASVEDRKPGACKPLLCGVVMGVTPC